MVTRLSTRLEEAERRTADALHGMETAFGELGARLKSAETRLEDKSQDLKLETLAASLTEQMAAVRAEMAEAIRASAADGRFERMEQAVEEITGTSRVWQARRKPSRAAIPLVMTKTGTGSDVMCSKRR